MRLLHRVASVVLWILRRKRAEERLDDELRTFVEMAAEARMRDGVSPGEARRLAMLGGIEQAKERVRTYRHGALLDEIGRDARHGLRMLVKAPSFTFIVVLTLALGVGANTAIFSLIDALMLRWLPVRNPHELVQVGLQPSGASGPGSESLSYPIAQALAQPSEIFAGVAGFSGFSFEVGGPAALTRVHGAVVTGGFYDTFGLKPVLGRLLRTADDEPGAPLVAVISYGYWERQLGRSLNSVGETIRLNGVPVTIVGVSPRGFVGANVGSIADVTVAIASIPPISPSAAPLLGAGNFWIRVLARPRAGISPAGATARLNALWPQISEPLIAPHWPLSRKKEISASTFQLSNGGAGWTYLREMYRRPLFVLMAVSGLVLLIAYANIASLLLARASARHREIGVRLAMGAARGRIIRQLLIESLLLSSTAAVVGIGLAWVSSQFLVSVIAAGPDPVAFDLTPNWHVLGFAAAAAIATGVLFGVAPAVQMTAVGPSAAMSMLFGLTATDPAAIGSAIVLLLFAAQIASYLPARRAARIDPLTALRYD